MSLEKGFLDAILREPGEPTHRLVYADWLEEQGDAERAEFVRAQCALARLDDDDRRPALEQSERDLWKEYRAHVLGFLQLKRPLRVAIDASNGMAGKMVPQVFGGVEKLEIIPILFEITGSFTHEPNPLVEDNLKMLKDKMRETKPDLGACFDGDADRCMFVDEQLNTLGCDHVTALLALSLAIGLLPWREIASRRSHGMPCAEIAFKHCESSVWPPDRRSPAM